MESSNGSGSETKPQNHQLERKRLNRAPSPARPFLKDVHSRSPKQHAAVPKSPKLNKQQSSTVSLTNQNRSSRRTITGAKDKPTTVKSNSKSSVTKKITRVHHAAPEPKIASKLDSSGPLLVKGKKGKLASLSHGPFSHGSPIRVPTGATLVRVSQTDSSSDLSDCPSEPLSDEQKLVPAASSDAESGTGSSDRDQVGAEDPPQAASPSEGTGGAEAHTGKGSMSQAHTGKGSMSQAQHSTGAHGEKCKPEKPSTSAQFKQEGSNSKYLIEEDLLREIEDLRSENDYLKDEVEELRAEMEEVRDSYMEEEVYQVQDLRRELDRSNKSCRILQYRLRKAEQKSLRVAQTGHVDGELLRNLEQDLKVAKDVSVRLHNELESVEDKRTRAEDENELLRQKIIEVEISKQAMHNELERAKESALRRRGSREVFKDKKSMNQEDSADLRCQLQFSKEESTLMRKKMAKLGREKDELEQELQRYKSVYGDVDSPGLPLTDCPGGGPHSTREAELRLRLKLVEEEANILGRKIVELEVENRSLRAENEDIRCQYERDCFGREPFASVPSSPYGGDAPESAGELRRHLQFVEEEAELLRRSIAEIEDHNKQLTSELNRFKFGPGPGSGSGSGGGGEESAAAAGEAGPYKPGNGGANGVMLEELKAARMQINELSGKVMKLQYENRVLMSNVQRCDLAAHLGLRTGSPRDAETDAPGRREEEEEEGEEEEEEEEEAGGLLLLHPKREGPVGGESDSEDQFEKTATSSGFGSLKPSDGGGGSGELTGRRRDERETFASVRREAERLGKTLERLIADTDSLVYEGKLLVTGAEGLGGVAAAGGYRSDSQVLDAINSRMKAFRTELHVFVEKVDRLGDGARDDLSPMPNLTESSSFLSGVTSMSRDSPIGTLGRDLVTDFQSGQREELEWRLGQERAAEPQGQSRGPAGHSRYQELRDTAGSEVQFRLDHERRLRAGLEDRESGVGPVTQEEERRCLEVRGGGLELHGLGQPPEAPWPQERALLQQPPEAPWPQERALLQQPPEAPWPQERALLQQPPEAPWPQERVLLQQPPEAPWPQERALLQQPPEAPWPQERALLQQEVRLFRHNTILFYMKLRCILVHWRLGRRAEAGDEASPPEFEKLENIPELGVILEQGEGEGEAEREDRCCAPQTPGDPPDLAPTASLPSPERLQHQRQVGENRRVLQALRTLLEDFRSELREEDARRHQLQQTYANEKASWEVKWAEMKCHVAQLEEAQGEARGEAQGAGGGTTGGGGGEEPDGAFRQEREEQRRLLADSHSASLDLRWKLQHGEKRWGRERAELLERFERDRQAWDGSMRDMHHKMDRLQRELSACRGDAPPADARDGAGLRGALSPQDSPRAAPRSPRSPGPAPGPAFVLPPGGEQGAGAARPRGPGESLFLDALSLDPLELDVPPSSRLESEKRFACMNEALNEIPDREAQPAFEEEEMSGGSLLRAKSVCSMSDFQRLMDSSPFLPDKSRRGDRAPDDATPPLSPDDLKYIEEFNSEAWDFPAAALAVAPPSAAPEPWGGEWAPGGRVGEPAPVPVADPFQPASWFLTTSATLTTDTLSGPEHCHRSPSLRGNGGGASVAGAEHYAVQVLHSPTRSGTPPEPDFLYVKGTKGGRAGEMGAGPGAPDEVFGGGGGASGGGRWACELPRHHKELLEGGGGLRPPATVGYAASLELQLSRNLSDDMKEVAFSVRNAIRPAPGATAPERGAAAPEARQVRDTACQTNGFTTRSTQTTHTISVGLQTDALRTLTSSPHRCLTPKGGGSTPISSPSRSLRKIQYSPVVQSKFERPCCSPKYGSPKLQRKLSVPGKADPPPTSGAATAAVAAISRAPTPATPQKGNSESAWARSTTTRDSPVHTTINDGLSSLFNIIDHTPVGYDAAAPKFAKSPSRSRPAEPTGAIGPAMQDLLRIARGRSPSPVGPLGDAPGERTPEVVGGGGSVRQDLSAPPGYTLAENAARLLNKRLLEQSFREEKKLPAGNAAAHARDARQGETDRSQAACLEDLPRSPVAPPLESRFLRPARPANRRPPSRWAAHSPSSSPRGAHSPSSSPWGADGGARRFTFPPTGTILETQEPGPDYPPA